MELTPLVENLRRELVAAAESGGDEARALAERLTTTLDSAARLTLLEALSTAADEITRDLAPGSVEVRLRGRDPEFIVAVPRAIGVPEAEPEVALPEADDGAMTRINLRLPEGLKTRIEDAAARDRLSANAWLVRAAAAALEPRRRPDDRARPASQRYTGWVR